MVSRSDNVAFTNNRPKRSLKNTDLPGGFAILTPSVMKKLLAATADIGSKIDRGDGTQPAIGVKAAAATASTASTGADREGCLRLDCCRRRRHRRRRCAGVTKTSRSGRCIHHGDNRAIVLLRRCCRRPRHHRHCRCSRCC